MVDGQHFGCHSFGVVEVTRRIRNHTKQTSLHVKTLLEEGFTHAIQSYITTRPFFEIVTPLDHYRDSRLDSTSFDNGHQQPPQHTVTNPAIHAPML